jgi:anti-anti-sigma factor
VSTPERDRGRREHLALVQIEGATPRMSAMDADHRREEVSPADGAELPMSVGPGGELRPAGPIDIGNARLLHSALATTRTDPVLQVDLRLVTYLDSAAVSVLFAHAHKPMRILVRPGSAVANVLSICGLSQVARVDLVPVVGPVE